jgi:hypothetical protein
VLSEQHIWHPGPPRERAARLAWPHLRRRRLSLLVRRLLL